MKEKSLDSAEEYYYKKFIKHNRVKYGFLYGLGVLSGIIILSIVYLIVE